MLVSFPDVVGLPLPALSYRWQQDKLWACPHMDGGKAVLSSVFKEVLWHIVRKENIFCCLAGSYTLIEVVSSNLKLFCKKVEL